MLDGAGIETVFFYWVRGEKLTTMVLGALQPGQLQIGNYVYFGGRLVERNNQSVVTDRLGSVGGGAAYAPYGEELGTSPNGTEKFATYTRDAETGMDYADQRYYSSVYGRFTSADPYKASGGAAVPGSWNRYSYVQNDPINLRDPRGLFACPGLDDEGNDDNCRDEDQTGTDPHGPSPTYFAARILFAESSNNQDERAAVASVEINRTNTTGYGGSTFWASRGGYEAFTNNTSAFQKTDTQNGKYKSLNQIDCAYLTAAINTLKTSIENGPQYHYRNFRGGTAGRGTVIGNYRKLPILVNENAYYLLSCSTADPVRHG